MNFALTSGSSPGQALGHSRRAGEGAERCFERVRFDGEWSGVLCFSLDSGFRRNDVSVGRIDGWVGVGFGSGSRATPGCPSPLDSGFRRNDGGVGLAFGSGSRATPGCPSPLDSGFRRNDDGVGLDDVGFRRNDGGVGLDDVGFRRNDGGVGLAFGSGSRATPRCPSPLDSGFRRNDVRVGENDGRIRGLRY